MKKCYLNKQSHKTAKKLSYPIDVIGTKKPKRGIEISSTSCFTRYTLGNKNILVPKKGYKLVYE